MINIMYIKNYINIIDLFLYKINLKSNFFAIYFFIFELSLYYILY